MFGAVRKLIATGLLAGLAAGVAHADTLKFSHVFPADHYLWEHGGKVFSETLSEKTGGRITFETYPAGQLGKDIVTLLKSGISETGLLVPSYTPETLPLSSVAELPGLYSHSCEATEMFWKIAKPGAILDELEYKPQGMRVLFVSTLPPFKILTGTKEVKVAADLSGLKVRANGAAMDKTVRVLGATPIRVTAAEVYDALSRGTVDGGFWPYHSTPTYNLQKLLTHAVEGVDLGGGTVIFAISEKVWSGLSPEDQKIVEETAASAQTTLCQWLDAEEGRVRDDLVKNYGLQISTLSQEEAAEWHKRVDTVAEAWAQELDGRGQPGSKVLEAFRATKD